MTKLDTLPVTDTREAIPSREWLARWLHRPPAVPNPHTLVLGSCGKANLEHLGSQLAGYVNEHDPEPRKHWHAFSMQNLWFFAGDPAYRDLILASQPHDSHPGPPDSDIDRITRRLARLGGAVLEGQFSLDASNDLANAFRIRLCSHRSACLDPCHLVLNPEHFSRCSLIFAIGDSFLDWTSRN